MTSDQTSTVIGLLPCCSSLMSNFLPHHIHQRCLHQMAVETQTVEAVLAAHQQLPMPRWMQRRLVLSIVAFHYRVADSYFHPLEFRFNQVQRQKCPFFSQSSEMIVVSTTCSDSTAYQ